MLESIADELGGGIESHRLGVENGGAKDVRIMAFEPAGDIDQERKTGGVALWEAIFAKALDLAEAVLGELALIAIADHAFDHLGLK